MGKKPKVEPWYEAIAKTHDKPRPVFFNCLKAFLAGGALCALMEVIQDMLIKYGHMAKTEASSTSLVILIAVAALFTGLGYYDLLAQKVGAGLAVPITGFANSVVSATLEHKSEGYVLGSACNSMKLAGAVIVYGVLSAFVVALIMLILGVA